ncbi:MAG: metallophosphoesterase [Hyphomonadaceae bacterium]|nr:metallophosphoesterase [Hyphomonadaceae bacterium]
MNAHALFMPADAEAKPCAVPRRRIRQLFFALFAGALVLNAYAWLVEPRMLMVNRVTIESATWTGAPLTIAALGDVHVGGMHVPAERVEQVVRRINRLNPDLVVLLGDYADGEARAADRSPAEREEIVRGLSSFRGLTAKYGTAAAIGNHDAYYDRAGIMNVLEAAGVRVLSNANAVIERANGERFVVAGLEDVDTGRPDYEEAMARAPADAPVIVVAHNPDVFPHLPSRPALTLAGHTHCGQVSVPFVGRPVTESAYGQRYACGHVEEAGRHLFVTAGLGTSLLPVRFMNPPEIALITLRGPSAPPVS